MKIQILLLLAVLLAACATTYDEKDYKVRKGKFDASIIETGELKALNAIVITMPYIDWKYGYQFKVISLKEHGSHVKVGDTIAEIDKGTIMKSMIDLQNRYDMEKTNLNKLEIQNQNQDQEDRIDMINKEATFNMAKLQLEKFKFETDKKQKVKKLEFDKASIEWETSKERIRLQKIITEKNLLIQKIKLRQIKDEIRDIENNIPLFLIISSGNGILQISRNRETRSIYKVGDNVRSGSELATVPDLSEMKVLSTVNETDIAKISKKTKVVIRLDAFPTVPFESSISYIARVCSPKESQENMKIFNFETVLTKTDPMLKPGMTVSCEIFYAQLDDVFFVNNDCIQYDDTSYFVVKEQDKKKYKIKLGPGNSKFTVVNANLTQGEELMTTEAIRKLKK